MSALNRSGVARIESVSCASPGSCSAGGYYDASVHGTTFGQPFVVNEVHGTWHKAIPVPGARALNARKNGFISSVSCTRPGDCSAGGRYLGPKGPPRAFVVDEVNGIWRNAITLPVDGLGDVEVSALACASPGNCSAAGTRGVGGTARGLDGTFVVNQVNGRWRKPIPIPGKLTFVYGGWVQSVSCPSAGNCTVGGWYENGGDQSQAFVASEVNGTWHNYIKVPGALALPGNGGTQVASLSCPKPGNCTVAGNFIGGAGFLASEANGAWHNATPVPGLANLGIGQVNALSCATAGNCSAAGWYHDSHGQNRAFVISKVNGIWHNAIKVPGLSALNRSGNGQVTALSCARAGKCSAGGYYHATHYGLFAGQVFVASEG